MSGTRGQKKIHTIEERRLWLVKQIGVRLVDGRQSSYLEDEEAALHWAINSLCSGYGFEVPSTITTRPPRRSRPTGASPEVTNNEEVE